MAAVQFIETLLDVVLSTARLVGVLGGMVSALPSQGLPLTVQALGFWYVPLLLALNANVVVEPGASGAFQDRFDAVYVLPVLVRLAFHRLVTFSVAG
ncbi:MAG TPA: hypothetical protein VGD84_05935, partial [Pseudonocardiaceae bacterium]